MPHAIRIHAHGGPEVLQWEAIEPLAPGPGEVLIRQTAIGLNFIDVYERTGLYPGALPLVLGREGAGVVEAVGPKVRGVTAGERVAYVSAQPGSYAQERVMPADRLVRIPDGVSDRLAAATVIGVVGSDAKAAVAREHGCHHVIVLGRDDLAARVRELTGGAGAHVVYDSVGKDTFFASLDSLRPLGMMVTYGNASGPVPPVAPLELARRGSLFLTRPTLFHYIARRAELERGARELFDVIGRGVVRIEIGQTFALQDAAQAHRDLEARRTIGSTVLIP